VEVFTLKQAGRPLSELSRASIAFDKTSDVHISVSRSNPSTPLLRFPEGSSENSVLETLSQTEPNLEKVEAAEALEVAELTEGVFERETSDNTSIMGSNTRKEAITEDASADAVERLQLEDYERQVASWKSSWLQVSLEDVEIKFAVSEASKSSGVLLTDCRLSSELCSSLVFAFLTRP
jgi:hypothetical protein